VTTPTLSPSLLAVAQLLADGLTVPEIAARRRRSYQTVRNQCHTLRIRLGCLTNAGAVAILLRRKEIT
jgi:DNA-binding NarL/FixJ family response regulator